jgi:hypothetical protein
MCIIVSKIGVYCNEIVRGCGVSSDNVSISISVFLAVLFVGGPA